MIINSYGMIYDVEPVRLTYLNGNLCIRLMCKTGEPFGTLTKNLDFKLAENEAYVDTNNIPDAERFIKDNNLGVKLKKIGRSGFCEYPLYQFDLGVIK